MRFWLCILPHKGFRQEESCKLILTRLFLYAKERVFVMDYFTAKEMFVLGIVLGASLVLIFTLILKGEM
jgi:hypothetical protein